MRCRPVLALALLWATLVCPAGAGAQTRAVVVPPGAEVVVPPRGMSLPRPASAAARGPRRPLPPIEPVGGGWSGPASAAGTVLPALAAAALTAALSNGGGGSGAPAATGPARTR